MTDCPRCAARDAKAKIKAGLMRQYQADGRKMSDKPPFGWRVDLGDRGRIVESNAEQAAIRCMKLLQASGHSPTAIARMLRDLGHKPRGSRWWPSTVRRVLKLRVP
jgi:hypothetical protein